MDDLLSGLERAVRIGTTPEERLRTLVRFHVLFHVERQAEATISRSELRSLTASNLRRVVAKRDRYEAMVRTLLSEGVHSGAFEVRDVPVTATAILTMCSGVSDWFSSQGRLSADAVAEAYADMVQRMVGRARSQQSSSARPRSAPATAWAAATRRALRRPKTTVSHQVVTGR
jgi:Tetracyclin repressor-like, C-terminal domain